MGHLKMDDIMRHAHRALTRGHVVDALHRGGEAAARTARFIVCGRYEVGPVPVHAREAVETVTRLVEGFRRMQSPPARVAEPEMLPDVEEDNEWRAQWDQDAYMEELQDQVSSMSEQIEKLEGNVSDLPMLRREVARSAAMRDKYGFLHDETLRQALTLEQLSDKLMAVQEDLTACQADMRRRLAAEAQFVRQQEQQRASRCVICLEDIVGGAFHGISCSQQHRVCCACAHKTEFSDMFMERRYRTARERCEDHPCPCIVLLHSCPGCWMNPELRNAVLDYSSGAYTMTRATITVPQKTT